jgi:hypothetical protein
MTFFQKTGLLAHPGETTAQILTRAHKREADAMFLVALGYTFGACGFPPNVFMAVYWAGVLDFVWSKDTMELFHVLLWDGEKFDATLGSRLAGCALARESPYLNALKNTGIDLEELCSRYEKFKPQFPSWETDYERYMSETKNRRNEDRAFAALMRELRSRPATLDEQDKITKFAWNYSELALFFAATTHNPDKELPDWSAERLTAFLAVQREQLEKEHQAGKEEMRPGFIALIHEAAATLARRLWDAPPGDMDALIHDAHLGDYNSIRTVTAHYANGTAGFVKSEELSTYWLHYAAMFGDWEAALASAAQLFARGRLSEAWAWASMLLEFEGGDAGVAVKTSARTLVAKIEAIQGEKQAAERNYLKKRFTDTNASLVKWRLAGEQK